MNVIGTMQLLAACQKSDTVERVVVRSTTAVYGCGPSDPAVFTEDMRPQRQLARPATRRTPSRSRATSAASPAAVRTSTSACCGWPPSSARPSTTRSPATWPCPLAPAAVGFDPRMQLLHEDDAVEALRLAATSPRPGVVNVAGDGVVLLSQACAGPAASACPVPAPRSGWPAPSCATAASATLTAEDARYLQLRTGRRHHPAAYRIRLHAAVLDGRRARVLPARRASATPGCARRRRRRVALAAGAPGPPPLRGVGRMRGRGRGHGHGRSAGDPAAYR